MATTPSDAEDRAHLMPPVDSRDSARPAVTPWARTCARRKSAHDTVRLVAQGVNAPDWHRYRRRVRRRRGRAMTRERGPCLAGLPADHRPARDRGVRQAGRGAAAHPRRLSRRSRSSAPTPTAADPDPSRQTACPRMLRSQGPPRFNGASNREHEPGGHEERRPAPSSHQKATCPSRRTRRTRRTSRMTRPTMKAMTSRRHCGRRPAPASRRRSPSVSARPGVTRCRTRSRLP